jgi:hypothetical protein
MANEFIARNGLIALDNSTITGSLTVTGGVTVNGTSAVTGTGTTNTLPKFTGASAIGNSTLQEVSGNLGLGVTPSAWSASWTAQQFGQAGSLFAFKSGSNYTVLSNNSYAIGGGYQSGDARYINDGLSTAYIQNNSGQHLWMTAPSGTAGDAITFTQAMTLSAAGRLLIGKTNDEGFALDVNGTGRFSGQLVLDASNNQIRSSNELRFYRTDNAIYTQLYDGGGANGFVIDNRNGDGFSFQSEGTNQLRIASTGAATFTSSVTAATGGGGGGHVVTYASASPALDVTSTLASGVSYGIIAIYETTNTGQGCILLMAAGVLTLVSNPSGNYTTTVDTASKWNITVSGGVISIQNKRANGDSFQATINRLP